MPETIYKDIRQLPPNANPIKQFRPSGVTRIIKNSAQATIFATLLKFGFKFNGFGLHTYFLQTTNQMPKLGNRVITLATLLLKYATLSVPFFYAKEVIWGTIDVHTKDKPNIRNLLRYAYVNNYLATIASYPIALVLYNFKAMTALRAILLLCCFSMANDIFLEYKRKRYLQMNYSRQEMKQMEIRQKMDAVKNSIHAALHNKDIPLEEKRRFMKMDLNAIEKLIKSQGLPESQKQLEQLRQKQMEAFGEVVQERLTFLKGWF